MKAEEGHEIIYAITVEHLQREAAQLLGRELNEDELESARDYIEWGIGESIGITYRAAVEAAVADNAVPPRN